MCIQEYFWLVLCWEVCPLLECPLSEVSLYFAATKYKEAHETAQQEQDRARKDRARERRQQNRAREGGKGKAQQDGGGSGDNSESRNYKELKQRTQRCKQLQQVAAKMKRQKDLMVCYCKTSVVVTVYSNMFRGRAEESRSKAMAQHQLSINGK